MDKYRLLYQSSLIPGSFFNRMIDCGPYDRWVEIALEYLPPEILFEHRETLAFVSTAHRDATRLARELCETREIIILSDHIMPSSNLDEGHPTVRYFIYAVLHEVAHGINKHRSPLLDNLTGKEFQAQEDEADGLALEWFNEHVNARANPNLLILTVEEIAVAQAKSRAAMTAALKQA